MQILQPIELNEATGDAKAILDNVEQRLGAVPNLLRMLAHSPAILRSYLGFTDAFNGELSEALRTFITVAIAQAAGAEYLLSFADILGKREGLADGQMSAARLGQSADAKTSVVLRLAMKAVRAHGRVSESDLAEVREAGYTEAELVSILGYISLTLFRVYFTLLSQLRSDYPIVKSSD